MRCRMSVCRWPTASLFPLSALPAAARPPCCGGAPTSGTLLVNGMSAEQARLARRYGYVFQAPALFPWRTIEKNLKLPLEIMGFSDSEQQERAARYLALVNLTGFERKFPWQLSGGMQQRVWIARALSFAPELRV